MLITDKEKKESSLRCQTLNDLPKNIRVYSAVFSFDQDTDFERMRRWTKDMLSEYSLHAIDTYWGNNQQYANKIMNQRHTGENMDVDQQSGVIPGHLTPFLQNCGMR